jgi:hypothetical protein
MGNNLPNPANIPAWRNLFAAGISGLLDVGLSQTTFATSHTPNFGSRGYYEKCQPARDCAKGSHIEFLNSKKYIGYEARIWRRMKTIRSDVA